MEAQDARYAVVSVQGKMRHVADLDLGIDRTMRLELPARFTSESVRRAQRDFELIASTMRAKPTEVEALLNACYDDPPQARELAAKLDLTEDSFAKHGGGIFWAVVAAFTLGFLIGSEGKAW